jgi:hypothetical protein
MAMVQKRVCDFTIAQAFQAVKNGPVDGAKMCQGRYAVKMHGFCEQGKICLD